MKTTELGSRFQVNLRTLRRKRNLTQAEFARRMEWKEASQVSQLELGRRGASFQLVEEIAEMFDVPPERFFKKNAFGPPPKDEPKTGRKPRRRAKRAKAAQAPPLPQAPAAGGAAGPS